MKHVIGYSGLFFVFVLCISGITSAQFVDDSGISIVCPQPNSVSRLRLDNSGKFLCWDGSAARLLAYSSFDLVAADHFKPNSTPTNHNSNGIPVDTFINTIQFNDSQATNKHGANLVRILASGSSCANQASPCLNYFNNPETMPFKILTTGKYDVNVIDTATYIPRLQSVLTKLNNAGAVVELTLFDGVQLGGNIGGNNAWLANPWNPSNNNIDPACKLLDGLPIDAFPEFYKICTTTGNPCPSSLTDATQNKLNCLGKLQQNYVHTIVQAVKDAGVKNVFFEVMNEAPINQVTNKADFTRWINTVGKWVSQKGNFLVATSTGPGYKEGLNTCANLACGNYSQYVDSQGNTKQCGTGGCLSDYEAFYQSNIDIVAVHSQPWCPPGTTSCAGTNPCNTVAEQAWKTFGHPVIVSDDGSRASSERNTGSTVQDWAKKTMFNCVGKGGTHFEHLDGDLMVVNSSDVGTCQRNSDPTKSFIEYCLDCATLDAIADADPSCLRSDCGVGFSSAYCTGSFSSTLAFSVSPSPADTTASGLMMPVTVSVYVNDLQDPNPQIQLLSITATEPVAATDIQDADWGNDDRFFYLKAVKSGNSPRIYTITYRLIDQSGNQTTQSTIVTIE